jgi:NADPH-dependent 2,4-dienoyl-CoA reductase/sulfur reductase-like enzyme
MVLDLTRRRFAAGLGFTAASIMARPAFARGEAKVVIIGGGAGGATVAGALKTLAPALDVTLVEPQAKYTSCFFSNAYIGGLYSLGDLTHGYSGLAKLGINVIHDRAETIDTIKKTVGLKTNKQIPYDRLVVSPGIDFKWSAIEGYSQEAAATMPHAWRGGDQTFALRDRLEKMENGGTVVISAPKLPYRCPPGPYERACVIANYLKQAKPKSKLIILDAKMTFSKQSAFQEAFDKYYKDIIELNLSNDIDDFTVTRVDASDGEVRTNAGLNIKAAVANIIPPQTAGAIALQAGLADPDWCPIDPASLASSKAESVFVLGDSAIANEMPKSAFSAHSQGLAVAARIVAELESRRPEPAHYRNTCWSIVAPDDAIKIGADYTAGPLPGGINGLVPSNAFVSKPGETAQERKAIYDEAFAWYPTLISQIFRTDPPAKSVKVKAG